MVPSGAVHGEPVEFGTVGAEGGVGAGSRYGAEAMINGGDGRGRTGGRCKPIVWDAKRVSGGDGGLAWAGLLAEDALHRSRRALGASPGLYAINTRKYIHVISILSPMCCGE